jgi:hypothetical protein
MCDAQLREISVAFLRFYMNLWNASLRHIAPAVLQIHVDVEDAATTSGAALSSFCASCFRSSHRRSPSCWW